jgi:hypothetical protein
MEILFKLLKDGPMSFHASRDLDVFVRSVEK